MKKQILFFFLCLLIIFSGCLGKDEAKENTDSEEQQVIEDVESVVEDVVLEKSPAVVARLYNGNITDVSCFVESEDGDYLEWKFYISSFEEITFLGLTEKYDYQSGSSILNGEFGLCEVEEDGEQMEVWIYKSWIIPEAEVGVVVEEGAGNKGETLLWNDNDLTEISNKAVYKAERIIVYKKSSGDAVKVVVPSVSVSNDYYLPKDVVSTHDVDVSVSKVLDSVEALGDDQLTAKKQILNSALDRFSGSILIDLVVEKLNELENPSENNAPDDSEDPEESEESMEDE